MSNVEPLQPDEAKRERFVKWLIAKGEKWLLNQGCTLEGDEEAQSHARHELFIAEHSTESKFRSLTQLGKYYWALQMWKQAAKVFEEAKALDCGSIWNYEHDVMLWYSKGKIEQAADAEAEAQERRVEKGRD